MEVVPLSPDRLDDVVELIRRRQTDPRTYVAYLSDGSDAITAELTGLEPDGLAGVLVALSADGTVAGALGAEHAVDPPRVWWFGPYVADHVDGDAVADLLYDRSVERLPDRVSQEELAVDERSSLPGAFARRHDFVAEEPSSLLSRRLDGILPEEEVEDPSLRLRRPTEADRRAAAGLHDEVFPGTHSTGTSALRAAPERIATVALRGEQVVGYAVAELEEDGSGYLDYVAVGESGRGRRLGGALVTEICRLLRVEHDCPRVHLTVRISNAAARRLYARLGFDEERVLRPWRKGFSLGDG